MLAFTTVYFFESGLFNELCAIQIKNFPSPRLRLCTTSRSVATRSRAHRQASPADGDCHTMDSEFLQDIALFREWRREAILPANRRTARMRPSHSLSDLAPLTN